MTRGRSFCQVFSCVDIEYTKTQCECANHLARTRRLIRASTQRRLEAYGGPGWHMCHRGAPYDSYRADAQQREFAHETKFEVSETRTLNIWLGMIEVVT